jgi:hypothetical protein
MRPHLHIRLATCLTHARAPVYSGTALSTPRPSPEQFWCTLAILKSLLLPDTTEFIGTLSRAYRYQTAIQSP